MTNLRVLSIEDVCARTSLSRVSVYRKMRDGVFPKSIPLGPMRVAWVESEVERWIQERIAERGTLADARHRQEKTERALSAVGKR